MYPYSRNLQGVHTGVWQLVSTVIPPNGLKAVTTQGNRHADRHHMQECQA